MARTSRTYSVAQIQFDCLGCIMEFGRRPAEWTLRLVAELPAADEGSPRWLARTAPSIRAAEAASAWLGRYGVRREQAGAPAGPVVLLVQSG